MKLWELDYTNPLNVNETNNMHKEWKYETIIGSDYLDTDKNLTFHCNLNVVNVTHINGNSNFW